MNNKMKKIIVVVSISAVIFFSMTLALPGEREMIDINDCNYQDEWNKTYGGSGCDVALSVQQTSDGGYIMTGYTEFFLGHELYDIWLIKTDSNGNEEWNKKFFRIGKEMGYEVHQTSDGGYIIVGTIEYFTKTRGPLYPFDVWLIKTDSNGNEEWNKKFGRITISEGCYSVDQTSDGGYILAGYTTAGENSDILLIKTDSNGNMQWERRYGGIRPAKAYSIQQTSDGGFIVVGLTSSYGSSADVWLMKVSPLYIARPKGGRLYIADREIRNTPILLNTVIISGITIKVSSYCNISIFNRVEFYVDDKLEYTDIQAPFEWLWDKTISGEHTLKVIAYDNDDKVASHEMSVFIL